MDKKKQNSKKETPPKGVAVVTPKVAKKAPFSHSISGLALLPDYESHGKYYATIRRSTGNSKELPYNTTYAVKAMIIREVGRGNIVVIRKGKRQLVLKQK